LKEENSRLKARNLQMEHEINRMSRTIEDHGHTVVSHRASENSLVESLKNTVKQLRSDVAMKDEELLSIKKSVKFTKMNELEVENKNLLDELLRLKTILENTLRQKADIIMYMTLSAHRFHVK
jgi:uncharacterized membrane-anchored protein YhcB (DUF1043 family)